MYYTKKGRQIVLMEKKLLHEHKKKPFPAYHRRIQKISPLLLARKNGYLQEHLQEEIEKPFEKQGVGKFMWGRMAKDGRIVVRYITEVKQMKVQRIISFESTETMLTKVPALNAPKSLPAESGLLWLFDAVTGAGKPQPTQPAVPPAQS